MTQFVRSILAEPRPQHIPARTRWDLAMVALFVVMAAFSAVFEPDVAWRALALPLGVVVALSMIWRRQHPLAAVAFAFGLQGLADGVTLLFGEGTTVVLVTGLVGLILTYAVVRWGSGRDVAVATPIILISYAIGEVHSPSLWFESVVGTIIWLFAGALAVIMRYRSSLHDRRVVEARINERQQLARELHDTVAHHVSAIAIQAQAGQAIAASRPEAASDVLSTIETAASDTLSEMRRMVGVLRDGDAGVQTAPRAGLDDIGALARDAVGEAAGGPPVEVHMTGELDDLDPAIEASLFRLVQEAITNARRHAQHATRISVSIEGVPDSVHLRVFDDGDPPAIGASRVSGFGLVGMSERALLLGGSLEAGPGPDRGWVVDAVLPRNGAFT